MPRLIVFVRAQALLRRVCVLCCHCHSHCVAAVTVLLLLPTLCVLWYVAQGGVPKAGLAPQAGLQEVMKARSCQQEAEAAHPAPARGRWKRNASMKRKPPIQRQLGGGGS